MDKIRVEVSGSIVPLVTQPEENNIVSAISKFRETNTTIPEVHIIDNMRLKANQCKIIFHEKYEKTIKLTTSNKVDEFINKFRKLVKKKFKE